MRTLRIASLVRVAPLLVAAALTTGCLRITYTLNIKPDGSGTIVQTIGMSKAAMTTAMGALAAAMEVKDAKPGEIGPIPFFTEQELKDAVASMGEGVRLVSVEPVSDDAVEGQTATFAFDDIRKVNLNLMSAFGPLDKMSDDLPKGGGDVGVRFDRQNGESILVLTMPEMDDPPADVKREAATKEGGEKPDAMPEVPPEVAKMVQEMFNGFFIEIAVNIDGTIVSTDAPFVDGTKITLMQMDFGELLKTAKGLQELSKKIEALPDDIGEMFAMPGLKVVGLPEIRIAFKSP